MNWEAIGAIGEIVGATAVVLSLIYLAIQVRQGTAVARASTRHAITEAAMVGGRVLAENDRLGALLLKHVNGEDLQPDETVRLTALAYMTTRNWENIHYQYLSGMLNEDEWLAFRENLRALYQHSAWRDYWSRESDIYTPAFRPEIESLLAEIGQGRRSADASALFLEKAYQESDQPGTA